MQLLQLVSHALHDHDYIWNANFYLVRDACMHTSVFDMFVPILRNKVIYSLLHNMLAWGVCSIRVS